MFRRKEIRGLMKYEKSCGAVIFRPGQTGKLLFLAVQSKVHGHWGFPKGHVEAGETEEETAIREVREETGLEIAICQGFRTTSHYQSAMDTQKEVVFFPASPDRTDVRMQYEEIEAYRWVEFQELWQLLTFETDKKVLKEVLRFLETS